MMIQWLLQSSTDYIRSTMGSGLAGWLSAPEQVRLDGFRFEKRRQEWLLGRWTAKRLLQAYVESISGHRLPMNALIVGREPGGAPFAAVDPQLLPPGFLLEGEALAIPLVGAAGRENQPRIPMARGVPLPLCLSISHSEGAALCAVHAWESARETFSSAGSTSNRVGEIASVLQIGADIEHVVPRSARFLMDYFTAGEVEAIDRVPASFRDVLVTATWSAKESGLKALRLGLTVDTRLVSCLCDFPAGPVPDIPQAWSKVRVTCDPRLLLRVAGKDSQAALLQLRAWWRAEGDYVLTLAALTAAPGDPQIAYGDVGQA